MPCTADPSASRADYYLIVVVLHIIIRCRTVGTVVSRWYSLPVHTNPSTWEHVPLHVPDTSSTGSCYFLPGVPDYPVAPKLCMSVQPPLQLSSGPTDRRHRTGTAASPPSLPSHHLTRHGDQALSGVFRDTGALPRFSSYNLGQVTRLTPCRHTSSIHPRPRTG